MVTGMMSLIYGVLKCLPTKDKIIFLSRQHNTSNVDFDLMIQYMQETYPQYRCKVLAKRLEGGVLRKAFYAFHVLHQMYELATSSIAILDTYCIPVSLLTHKEDLYIIQIWHAIGAFKKFGYSIIGKEEGSSEAVVRYMKMHRNYDYVCASSVCCVPAFAEAFQIEEDRVKVFPLPRLDVLEDKAQQQVIQNKIYAAYPQLVDPEKKVILYAPTFRKDNDSLEEPIRALSERINHEAYVFIVKVHPLTKQKVEMEHGFMDQTFQTSELMTVADYVITDYSAIVFEAAFLRKPIFFYGYDYDAYVDKRDFYIDYKEEIPGRLYQKAEALIADLEANEFSSERILEFRQKYITNKTTTYTADLCEFCHALVVNHMSHK